VKTFKTIPNHAPKASSTANPTPAEPPVISSSPQKVNFMARYKKWVPSLVDEVEEFFKLLQENFDNFDNCDPIQWWVGWHAQSHLSQLTLDILSIPGKPPYDAVLHQLTDKYHESDLQVQLLPLNTFSLVDGIQSPCAVPA
jgi:hypothetical protein